MQRKRHEFCIAPVSAETFTRFYSCDYDAGKQERFWEVFNYYRDELWDFHNVEDAIVQCIDEVKYRFDKYDHDQMRAADNYRVSEVYLIITE